MAIKEESFSDNLMSINNGAPLKYSDHISYATAFSHARNIFGEDGLFIHRGKIYSTKGGDMAPQPTASMEQNVYEPGTQQGQEGNQVNDESSEGSEQTAQSETAPEGAQAQPAKTTKKPVLKKKPSQTESNGY